MTMRIAIACAAAGLLAACGAPEAEQPAQAAEPAEAAQAAAPAGADGPPFVRAHDIQELMAYVLEPQAQVFWGSAGWVIDAEGEHDLTPTTEEGWLATRSAAATVTEMGNLLMTPLYAEGRGPDWTQFSSALVEIGQQAEQAAVDRDSDAIFDTGGTMYRVCQACHQVYIEQYVAPPSD